MIGLIPNPLLPILWVVVVHLAAYALGRPLYARIRRGAGEERHDCHAALHALLLGFAALALVAFTLAAAGLLFPEFLRLLIAALALSTLVGFARRRPKAKWTFGWSDAPAVLAILFLAQFVPEALSPVLQQDDQVYHLLLPKIYLARHQLISLPWHINANMPHLTEILYAVVMAIGDYTTPKILTLSFEVLILFGLWSFAVERCGRFGAGVLLLIYLSGKNVQWHLGIGHVEPVIGAYLLAAVLALDSWMREARRSDLLLIGVYCGFAAASKYTAWLFVAAIVGPLLLLLWWRPRGPAATDAITKRARAPAPPRSASPLRDSILALGAIALFVLPWLIKNTIDVGNPIFPNLHSVLGGHHWSEIQENHYRLAMSTVERAGPHWTWGDRLRMPFHLAFSDHYYSCPSFSIVLMMLFLIGLIPTRSREGRWVAVVAFLGFLGWTLSAPQGRYLVGWVPVMSLVAAPVLARLEHRSWVWRIAALLVVLVIGAYQLLFQRETFRPRWNVLATPREELQAMNRPGYDLARILNRIVPPNGRVLGLWENRFFFLDRDFEADCVWQVPSGLARLRVRDDPDRFPEELAREGFTHVVLRPTEMDFYFSNRYAYDVTDPKIYPRERYQRDLELMKRFIQTHLELEGRMDEDWIYRLHTTP